MNTAAELLEQREVVERLTKTLRDETAKSSDLASKLRLAEEALQVNAESDAKDLENQLLNVSADLLESRAVIERLTEALDIARAQIGSSQSLVEQSPVREGRTNSSQSPVEQKSLRAESLRADQGLARGKRIFLPSRRGGRRFAACQQSPSAASSRFACP